MEGVKNRIKAVQVFYSSYTGIYPKVVVLSKCETVTDVQKCIRVNLMRLNSDGAALRPSLDILERLKTKLESE